VVQVEQKRLRLFRNLFIMKNGFKVTGAGVAIGKDHDMSDGVTLSPEQHDEWQRRTAKMLREDSKLRQIAQSGFEPLPAKLNRKTAFVNVLQLGLGQSANIRTGGSISTRPGTTAVDGYPLAKVATPDRTIFLAGVAGNSRKAYAPALSIDRSYPDNVTVMAKADASAAGARPVRSLAQPSAMQADRTDAANTRRPWLNLDSADSRIDTPTSALMAVLNLHGMDVTQREHIFKVLDTNVHISPALLAGLIKPELLDEASMLHANSIGVNSSPRTSIQRHQDFAAALSKDRLQHRLFLPSNLGPDEHASGIYFDGNALVNAVGRSVDDLANNPSVMRLPSFAAQEQPARRRMILDWLDAHGQDTQYPFGTFEHSMASVLKTAALSRGESAPPPYASVAALGEAFARLVQQWPSQNSTLVNPKILFALHLVKTQGIELHGPSSQRLDELRETMKDLVTEAGGPPVFDRRSVALELLVQETGMSRHDLALRGRRGKEQLNSILDEFLHHARRPEFGVLPLYVPTPGRRDSHWEVLLYPAAMLREAEARFKAGLPRHPWFAARARLALRREEVPLTRDTIAEEIKDLVAQYEASPAQSPSELRHWLDNMPVISSIIGIGEGIARGDAEEIISSVPVIGNIYNAVEGVATGDGKRTATALITLIPYVGSGYIIADGVANNDTAETVGGVMGLGLDFVTDGEGHLLTRSHVVGHSALGEGKVAAHTFSHHEVPSVVRLQAQHSLGALKDLGMDDHALMLTDRKGEHGRVGDPYALKAVAEEAVPSVPETQQLLERLTPVPEDKQPIALRHSEGGTWQDPDTLVHYAQIGAKLYRVAKDESVSTGERPIWNPMDATGNARERTIRLEFREGQWLEARDAPGLKGGAPEPVRLHQFSADEVDIELVDPAIRALVDPQYAEQALGQPLSPRTQEIHDSLFAPGRQPPDGPQPGSSRARPHARLKPTLREHTDLLEDLPEELDPRYDSNVRRFLVHLEEQGQLWSQLVPAGSGPGARPAALEQAVNEGIRRHGLQTNTRAALNQAFGFTLRGDANYIRLEPDFQVHKDLLKNLPEDLSTGYRSSVNRFLGHLEEQGQSWSQLVPAGSGPGARPAALEQAVNAGIRHHGLQTNTRAAINQAFGFTLQAEPRRAQVAPELQAHKDLLENLPEDLSPGYRSGVKRFLGHLEEQDQSWSQLVPAGSGPGARPAALERAVNEGIRHHGLHPGTRAAINQAFGFTLQAEPKRVGPAPELQAHQDLLENLPEDLDHRYRSNVNRFLIHLEEQGQSWSQLVPAGSGPGARPAALEQALNAGIRHHGVHPGTRAALNHAFGFTLQGEKRVRLAPSLQEHKDLLKNLPEELGHRYRSNINRFLAHLEEQGQSWSQLVPAASGPGARPAALEQAVNAGIRHHGLQTNTRAALNQAFGFTLQSY
jgi:type II secretory pathway component PulM